MNCGDVQRSLVAYLDRRADSAERREFEAHLSACKDCRGRAEQFRALWGVLDEMPVIEPSFAFDARVRQRVAAEPQRRWFTWLVPQPRLVAATALLAVLAVWIAKPGPANRDEATTVNVAQEQGQQEDFETIKNLNVLENFDVVTSMDALSQLTPVNPSDAGATQQN
jgi:anti-sigma factor RsiW